MSLQLAYAKGPSGPGFQVVRNTPDFSAEAQEAKRQYYQSLAFDEKIQYFLDSTKSPSGRLKTS